MLQTKSKKSSKNKESSVNPDVHDINPLETDTNSPRKKKNRIEGNGRVLVNFKKSIETMNVDPKSLHPKILSVRLPRKGTRAKFCFLIFKTNEIALDAVEELKERGDCFVRLVTSEVSGKTKEKKDKPAFKCGLRKLWA